MSLFSNNITMRNLEMMEASMDTAVMRGEVLANNMANVSVPHFKRSEVAFESELKRALDSEKAVQEDAFPLRRGHEKHIGFPHFRVKDYRTVKPKVHIDYNSTMRNDGNNVDIEDETMKAVRNQLHYGLISNRVGNTFRMMNQLIRLT